MLYLALLHCEIAIIDTQTFTKLYESSDVKFIWHYDVIAEYIPVLQVTIGQTFEWFKLESPELDENDIGIASIESKGGKKIVALYINNKKTKDLGTVYSMFKENYRTITTGHNDKFPLLSIFDIYRMRCETEKDKEQLREQELSLRRKITTFRTLANKSMNRQRNVPPKLRLEVLARDGFRCALCGRGADDTSLHVDHITPVAKGGYNTIDYLVTLCRECNLGKGVQTINEILKRG